MEVINLEQGTQEWLAWRDKGIGSSDAAALMGFWGGIDKRKGVEIPSNYRMERGKALEPHARMLFIDLCGVWVRPLCVQHAKYNFLRASLDGISDDRKVMVEIKCPSRKSHELAIDGSLPKYYIPQVQHQMLVTGLKSACYFSYMPEHESRPWAMVRVDRDDEMCNKIFERAQEWRARNNPGPG